MLRATLTATLLATLALATGCSSSKSDATPASTSPAATATPSAASSAFPGLTAVQIWKQSQQAAHTGTSVHVIADLADGKNRDQLDMRISRDHKAFGTLTSAGVSVTIRRTGSALYFTSAGHGWTKASKSDKAYAAFYNVTDMDAFVKQSLSLTSADEKVLARVPGITINSQPTVGLNDPVQATTNDEPGVLYVAATGKAYPLEVTLTDGSKQFIKFQDWDQPVSVAAPTI
jgi:hypothetical protein